MRVPLGEETTMSENSNRTTQADPTGEEPLPARSQWLRFEETRSGRRSPDRFLTPLGIAAVVEGC